MDKDLTAHVKASVVAERRKGDRVRSRERIVFRASELGDIAAYRNGKGEPGGCQVKVFRSFHADRFPARAFGADALLNFERGDESEAKIARRLEAAGLLAERQVMLGAWTACRKPENCGLQPRANPDELPECGTPAYVHGDARYPDRSGGLVRGKLDFVIRHPVYGLMPLEWKSASGYVFGSVPKDGAKGDNSLQAHWYGYEMGTEYVAIGYEDKETGDFVILVAKTDKATIEAVLERARVLRDAIASGQEPPKPEGVRAPEYNESRYWGRRKAPPEPYFDRVFPCYSFGSKKGNVIACPQFEACWGPLPAPPAEDAAPAPVSPKPGKRKSGPFEFSK